jgi:GT2 family glycosyltransferase
MRHDFLHGQDAHARKWSIIIPALNEERHIQPCLDAVCSLGEGSFEVIVVDNGSVDRTIAIAKSYSARLRIRVVTRRGVTIGVLRNTGAAIATGRILIFLDADCLIPSNFLKHASRCLENSPPIVAGAYYALPPNAGWPARLWHQRFHAGRQGAVGYIPGGNLVIDRALFRKLGGFDPKLRSNEDSQFCSRARAAGIPVVVFPELATIHLGAEKNLRAFIARQTWHGSNVLSKAGMKGNVRALGLAGYTLFCLGGAFAALCAEWFVVSAAMAGAFLVPPIVLSLRGPRLKARAGDVPLLVLLLAIYAFVRACVLPRALIRCIQQRRHAKTMPSSSWDIGQYADSGR